VYVGAGDKSVDKRWRGIGIRIEDDVQVTRAEPDVLTKGIPTTVKEIERHMGSSV
jgi:Xaa-Pro aminopeptidase